MSKFRVIIKEEAQQDLKKLLRYEPASYKKALKLIAELLEHPRTGTGKPEALSGNRAGQWSRRISQKHRLIYSIEDMTVTVIVLTAYGHYDDK
jgi:toxin YoeB